MANPNATGPTISPTTSENSQISSGNHVIPSPNSMFSSLSTPISIKLDRNNYFVWKSQMIPTAIGHDLDGYLFGTLKAPQAQREDGSPNPDFLIWRRNDQLLLSWIRASMTEKILASMTSYRTSASLWQALERSFSSQSKARLLLLRNSLQTIRKGDMSIADYCDKIRSIGDKLQSAGQEISDPELVLYLLNGLSAEYESVTVNITSRSESLDFEDVQSQLLNHESLIERYQADSSATITLQANSVARLNSNHGTNNKLTDGSSSGGRGNSNNNQNSYNPNISRGNSNGGRRGRGGRGRIICQLCGRVGHGATVCYDRFKKDVGFGGQMRPPQANAVYSPQVQPTYTPQLVTMETLSDPIWHPDSGASAHVTANLQNLDLSQQYHGPEQVVVGNGQFYWQHSASRET